jgi:hypothetical protein
VWDLRNQRCLQTFSDQLAYKPEDKLGAIALGRCGRRELLTAAYHPRAWPLRDAAVLRSTAHCHPVTVVLHNAMFDEVGARAGGWQQALRAPAVQTQLAARVHALGGGK